MTNNRRLMTGIDDILQREARQLIADIRTNLKNTRHYATGKTAASLEARVNGGTVEIHGASHLATLETGRGPAKGGSDSGDFLQSLKEWIKAKGLQYSGEAELERLARFLKWHINKFGNEMYRTRRHNDIFTSAIESFEQRMISRFQDIKILGLDTQ